jgi:hypothetical protein
MPKLIAIVSALGIITAASAKEVWVSWPARTLQPAAEMNITDVKMTVRCGEIRAVRSIPPDWNVQVTRPISGVAEFRAEAGHGASSIPNLKPFEGVIAISHEDESCFDVKAHIIGHATEHKFSKKQLNFRGRPAK